MVVDNTEQQ